MRLLFVLQEFPFPVKTGTCWKVHNILTHLSGRHDCDLLAFSLDPPNLADVDSYARAGMQRHVLSVAQTRSGLGVRVRQAARLLAGAGLPSAVRWQQQAVARQLARALANRRYDLVHFDLVNVAWYRQFAGTHPCVMSLTDAGSMRYARRARMVRGTMQRMLLRIVADRLLAQERRILRSFDLVHLVSQVDAEWLRPHDPDKKLRVITMAVEEAYFHLHDQRKSARPGERLVVSIGDLRELHILEPVTQFVREEWPHIHSRCPEARFLLVGRQAPPGFAEQLQGVGGLEYRDWLEDYQATVAQADLAVFFDSGGSGVKSRVLQFLAAGVPCLGVWNAFEGMAVQDGQSAFVEKDVASLSQRLQRVLNEPQSLEKVGEAGHAYASAHHTVKVTGELWEALYQELAERGGTCSRA